MARASDVDVLQEILSKVNKESPIADTLFKDKYLFFHLDHFILYHKPMSRLFIKAYGVCIVEDILRARERRTISSSSSSDSAQGKDIYGSPADVVFNSAVMSHIFDTKESSIFWPICDKFEFHPMSSSEGNYILKIYNKISSAALKSTPLVTFCVDTETKSFLMLGSFLQEKQSRLKVKHLGYCRTSNELPNIAKIRETHEHGFQNSSESVETSVFARYDFLQQAPDMKTDLQPCKDFSLYMDCVWGNSKKILDPPISTSICSVNVKTIFGDAETGAFEKYKDIMLIEDLQKLSEKEITVWKMEKNVSTETFLKQVKDFMTESKSIKSIISQISKLSLENDNFEVEFSKALGTPRSPCDFTDELWSVLKVFPTLDDLKSAFSIVFSELKAMPMLPPILRKSTAIGKALQFSRGCVTFSSNIEALDPLILLAEIGIEKLLRDYLKLFTGLEIVPEDALKYYSSPKASMKESFTCLKKLQIVLEIAIILVKCLCLSKNPLRECVRAALDYYANDSEVDVNHVFCFKIALRHVETALEKMRPSKWELSLMNEDEQYRKQTCINFSIEPTIDHLYCAKSKNKADKFGVQTCYSYMEAILVQDNSITN